MPNYSGVYATPSGGASGNYPLSGSLPGSSLFSTVGWMPGQPEYGTQYWDPVTGTLKTKPSNNRYSSNPSGAPNQVPGTVKVPFSDQSINPNDPNQRYRPVDIVKSPDIASGQASLMDSFKKGATDSLKGFDEYLTNFKNALNGAFTKSQAATDPSQTIANLRAGQSRYSAGLDQAATDYRDLNRQTAAQEQALVSEARGLIPSYDTALTNAENLQRQQLQQGISRYKLGTGTPASLGSSEEAQLVAGAGQIAVPIELAKINQRYNVLDRYAMPATLDIANREQTRIGSFTPQQLAAQFQSGQYTEQTIQDLLMKTAGMAQSEAVQYMQAIGVPAQVQQQILSGQITQLGALSQIEDQSRYRGLQDVLGAYPTASQSYSVSTPGYGTPSRYSPTSGTGTNPMGAPNAPVTVNPIAPAGQNTIGDWVYDSGNQRWQNWKTGALLPPGQVPTAGGTAPAQQPYTYPPLPEEDMALSAPTYNRYA